MHESENKNLVAVLNENRMPLATLFFQPRYIAYTNINNNLFNSTNIETNTIDRKSYYNDRT